MPLFQLESAQDHRNNDEIKNLNQSSTVYTRLSSCQKTISNGDKLHLSSALSELNFKQKKQQNGSRLLGSQCRNSISQDSNNQKQPNKAKSPTQNHRQQHQQMQQ
eukprot:CAMPEP_0185593304 /NCGR_PEP_ID=MMETSP0434-20130131/71053_1 /TAXON_ID=626734 ORGANISM="Favella taraikaensis, Strain Fe Narragansett Bay" /NCGR_SAMPLE_ID=MMETSP0434 /ASSEMBLY_ACC=CAM_ASM_000379 /LENGTH=104 /DNA_ID=CAMNT_0028219803 /DNA_START=1587 /DNA_END=1901 /DNA_ORIENTATION=+